MHSPRIVLSSFSCSRLHWVYPKWLALDTEPISWRNFSPLSLRNISTKRSLWSSEDLLTTMMWSMCPRHFFCGKPLRTHYIRCSKVAEELHWPNDINRNCQKPDPSEKSCFSLSSLASQICQYSLRISNCQKILDPTSVFKVTPIRGKE